MGLIFLSSNVFAETLSTPKHILVIPKLVLDSSRTATLIGIVQDVLIDRTIKQLEMIDMDPSKPAFLVIDTYGGSVDAGMKLVETIKTLQSPLTCVIDHSAFSMGAIIASFCPRLLIQRQAQIMFHEASFSIEGNETHVRIRREIIQKKIDAIDEEVAERLGITVAKFKALKHDEWWLSARDAAANGFVSSIVDTLVYNRHVESSGFEELLRRLFPT